MLMITRIQSPIASAHAWLAIDATCTVTTGSVESGSWACLRSTKLGAFLAPRLPGANAQRIHDALTTLTLIKTVRHGMQHAKAAPNAAALHTLGIGYQVSRRSP
jgi:hypothetical protein